MRKYLALALLPASLVSALVPLYGQCGGIGYTGETQCESGATCVYSNDWYSQCLPSTGATTTTKATTTTTKTVIPTGTGVPAGAITIGKNGQGKYSTFSAALADTSSNIYYVYPGNYTEGVAISRANIVIYGQTSNKLTYSSNTVTISRNMPASQAGNNDLSGTVRILAEGVKLYNLNIENSFGQGGQAIALSVQAGKFGAYGCQLKGYQDTLLANKGAQFYGKTLIIGATDFIFGSYASIWVTGSTIQTIGNGWITASGRSTEDANYYVIDKSTITGTGSSHLGRPWRNYARVVFQNSNIGSHVPAAGWTQWSSSTPNTDHIMFGEYNNSGGGAWRSGRASFATKLNAGISITTVLGSGYTSWVDSAYL